MNGDEEADRHCDRGLGGNHGLQAPQLGIQATGTVVSELATRHGGIWVRRFGSAPAHVVALHGFTLHGGMYERLAAVAEVGFLAPDLPGHGRTTISPITTRTAVDGVADLLTTLDEPPLLLGYSQGGRIALQVALTYPDLVGSLMLVATSPGLNERARKLRTVADDGLASRIERIGTERFISEWLANPLVTTDRLAADVREADLAMRLENTAEGLAAALRGMGQATVSDSSTRIPDLPMPVDFVAGTDDERYAEMATTMAGLRGERPVLIEGAGHNVVIEQPEALAAAIRSRLQTD